MTAKRLFCLLLAVLLAFAAAGCGGETPNQADTDAVAAAVEKFRGCKSFTALQMTEIEEILSVEGEKLDCSVLNMLEIQLVTEPEFQMRTSTAASMLYDGEQVEQFSESYIVPENGGYAEYYSDGGQWYKLSTEEDVSSMGMGASAIVDTFFTDKIAFCKVAEESLDGQDAVRYEGALAKEDLMALLEANGQLAQLSAMSENQQAKIKENLIKDLKPLTVTVWISVQQGYPVRLEVNMADTLNDMQQSIAKSLGNKTAQAESELEKYSISMSLRDFDALDEILLPPETASAVLYEE